MKVTALIMAGKRSGVLDPLAKRAGVAQKCVVPVRGKPMIQHVVEAVAGCDRIGAIHVVAHEPDEIADILDYMDVSIVFCDDQEQVEVRGEIELRLQPCRQCICRGRGGRVPLDDYHRR